MHILVENQPLSAAISRARTDLEWVDTYDMLERNWPNSRNRKAPPPLMWVAARVVERRRRRPVMQRQSFRSTAEYYDALLPWLMAQSYWERIAAWRYVRPLMIRIILSRYATMRRRC